MRKFWSVALPFGKVAYVVFLTLAYKELEEEEKEKTKSSS